MNLPSQKKPNQTKKETLEIYKEITSGLAKTPVMYDTIFIPSLKETVTFGKALFSLGKISKFQPGCQFMHSQSPALFSVFITTIWTTGKKKRCGDVWCLLWVHPNRTTPETSKEGK